MPTMSTSSSPGAVHPSNSAPEMEEMKKKRNRSRIPDSIMETDEDEVDEQTEDEGVKHQKKKRLSDLNALEDDVFEETEERNEGKVEQVDGLHLNASRLGRYL